jgi:HAMP domain-containing protein
MNLFAIAPALPLHKAGPYVAAAYIVFLAVVLIYVAIMAIRQTRNQRELAELKRELLEREAAQSPLSAGSPDPETTPERQVTPQL